MSRRGARPPRRGEGRIPSRGLRTGGVQRATAAQSLPSRKRGPVRDTRPPPQSRRIRPRPACAARGTPPCAYRGNDVPRCLDEVAAVGSRFRGNDGQGVAAAGPRSSHGGPDRPCARGARTGGRPAPDRGRARRPCRTPPPGPRTPRGTPPGSARPETGSHRPSCRCPAPQAPGAAAPPAFAGAGCALAHPQHPSLLLLRQTPLLPPTTGFLESHLPDLL